MSEFFSNITEKTPEPVSILALDFVIPETVPVKILFRPTNSATN